MTTGSLPLYVEAHHLDQRTAYHTAMSNGSSSGASPQAIHLSRAELTDTEFNAVWEKAYRNNS